MMHGDMMDGEWGCWGCVMAASVIFVAGFIALSVLFAGEML
jgi:hypothetical protein